MTAHTIEKVEMPDWMIECGIREDSRIYHSKIKNQLKWKYRKQRFLAFTERSKEFVWHGVTIIFGLAVIAYFGAHFMYYIANENSMNVTSAGYHLTSSVKHHN